MLLKFPNFSTALLNNNKKIKDGINSLTKSGLQVILVINNQKKFVGTVTDGDIRRAILKEISLDSKIDIITNKKAFFLKKFPGTDKIQYFFKKKSINHIPIVNNGKIKFLCINNLSTITKKNINHINKNIVLIMAGGYGKRLLPLTKKTPKPMIKIANKPILEHIIEELIFQGFRNFIISTHYFAKKIKNYFKNGKRYNCSIKYFYEKKAKGTAGAIKNISKFKKPILLINGDNLTSLDFNEFIKFHNSHNNLFTVSVKKIEIQNPYGVLKIKNFLVKDINEKPIDKYVVNAGFYVVNPKISKFIKKGEYLNMNDLIKRLIKNKIKISAFPIHENWTDIGTLKNLILVRKKYKGSN